MSKSKPSFGRFTVASYLKFHLERCGKTQREVAKAAGFDQPNIITMIKKGDTRLPLERVPALAMALGVSEVFLMNLALSEYCPALYAVIQRTYGLLLTDNEREIVESIRMISGRGDPGLTPDVQDGLLEVFGPYATAGRLPSP